MNNTSPLSNQVVVSSHRSQAVDSQNNTNIMDILVGELASLSLRDNKDFDEVRGNANPDELRRLVSIDQRPHRLIQLYYFPHINEIVAEAVLLSTNLPKDVNEIIISYIPNPFSEYLKELPSNQTRVAKIREIGKQNFLFTELDLSDTQVTVSDVLDLVQLLPNLTMLNLNNCKNINNILPNTKQVIYSRNFDNTDPTCVALFDALISLEQLKRLSLENTSLSIRDRMIQGKRPIYDRIGKLLKKGVSVEFRMQSKILSEKRDAINKMIQKFGMLGFAAFYDDIERCKTAILSRSYTSNDILLFFDKAITNFTTPAYAKLLSDFISRMNDINMLFKNERFETMFYFEKKKLPCPFTLLELITYQKCGVEIFKTFLQRKEDIKINRITDTGKTVLDIWNDNHQEYLDELQNIPKEDKEKKKNLDEKVARSLEVRDFLISLGAKPRSAVQKEPELADHFKRLILK